RLQVDIRDRHETEVINIKNCHSGLGELREGDQLLEVNGCSLHGVSNDK
ncbi:unnamed protein product, partial [Porites evermanni]